jgi:hypothetical protein
MHLINGAHNNTINGNTFHSQTGLDISSGGNIINSVDSFYDACQTAYVPYTQARTPVMGSGNTFSNNCYRTTDIASLPTPVCAKSLPAPDGWAARAAFITDRDRCEPTARQVPARCGPEHAAATHLHRRPIQVSRVGARYLSLSLSLTVAGLATFAGGRRG